MFRENLFRIKPINDRYLETTTPLFINQFLDEKSLGKGDVLSHSYCQDLIILSTTEEDVKAMQPAETEAGYEIREISRRQLAIYHKKGTIQDPDDDNDKLFFQYRVHRDPDQMPGLERGDIISVPGINKTEFLVYDSDAIGKEVIVIYKNEDGEYIRGSVPYFSLNIKVTEKLDRKSIANPDEDDQKLLDQYENRELTNYGLPRSPLLDLGDINLDTDELIKNWVSETHRTPTQICHRPKTGVIGVVRDDPLKDINRVKRYRTGIVIKHDTIFPTERKHDMRPICKVIRDYRESEHCHHPILKPVYPHEPFNHKEIDPVEELNSFLIYEIAIHFLMRPHEPIHGFAHESSSYILSDGKFEK